MSFATLLIGCFVDNQGAEMVEDLSYITDEYLRKKYTPFRAWKFYIMLFQTIMVSELIVVGMFWTMLFSWKEFDEQITFLKKF